MARRREIFVILSAIMIMTVSCLIALTFGAAKYGIADVVRTFADGLPGIHIVGALRDAGRDILFQIRLPRVALAALVGGALSIAGASFQSVFRNPLVDPYLLGAASGAGLGATLVFAFSASFSAWPINPLPVAAFAGAIGAVALSSAMALAVGSASDAGMGVRSSSLLLSGIAVASFLTSVQTFVLQQRREVTLRVYNWILGGLVTDGWGEVKLVLPYVAISTIGLIGLARPLDVMVVGDEEARSLGVSPSIIRFAVVVLASLATAAAVAVAGLIGFVGLVVPHVVRAVVGQRNRVTLFVSFFIGAAFLVLTDSAARTLVAPGELPLGVITAFVGAPAFAFILIRQHRRQS
jgi:iron complex transport system permease protein